MAKSIYTLKINLFEIFNGKSNVNPLYRLLCILEWCWHHCAIFVGYAAENAISVKDRVFKIEDKSLLLH